ncbi:MAG: DUF5702 domain-containing protein [Clostridia bacterium]|nr:DUF5702 domain-containing protein [Clostridia bacterium]
MKRERMKQQKNKGAITVFLSIIFMALMLLTGLLADAARIATAERKVQSSLNTAVRSALAGYDEDLIGGYGIYGLDTQSGEPAVKSEVINYFNANIKERHQGLRFIDYDVKDGSIQVTGMGNLLNKEIYKRQIMEYMKYKAPLTITENVIDKFKKAKLGEKVDFSEKEKNAREAGRRVKESVSKLNRTVGKIASNLGKAAIKDFKDKVIKQVKDDPQGVLEEVKDLLDKSKDAKSSVNAIKGELDTYRNSKADADRIADNVGAVRTAGEFENSASDLDRLEKVLESNIEHLSQAYEELKEKKLQFDELKEELDSLKSQGASPASISAKQAEIDQKIGEMQTVISNLQAEEPGQISLGSGTGSDASEPHQEDKNDSKGFFKKLKIEFESKLMLKALKDEWLIPAEEFKNAEKTDAERFRNMDESMKELDRLSDEEVAEQQNKNILDFIKEFFNMLNDAAANAIENVYITEYVMDKYTFVTSQTERGHYFNKGEVEYILYGLDTEAKNVAAVMGQTWFLRFGIDTLDFFLTSKIPHPVARLVWALIEGATQSFIDMYDMYKGDEVYVCPSAKKFSIPVKVSYSDHLRIFLLLKSEDTKLNRMRQLMQINIMQKEKEVNKDFRLKNCNTLLQARVEVSINLWFLPLFQTDKFGLEQFKGGRYIIRKETTIGY